MPTPYIILVIGYVLLATLCLWFVKETEGKWAAKFIMVPAVIWFGLFLYFTPPQIAGYPSDQEITQERVLVRFYSYEQPTKTSKGKVYVVVDTRFFKDLKEKDILDYINPSTYSDISEDEYLRLYRIPWDDKMVQNMNKAKKKKQVIILSKNKGDNGGNQQGKDGKGDSKKHKRGDKKPKPGNGVEEGKGGTGGNAKNQKEDTTSKYRVEGLTPNRIVKKGEAPNEEF